MKTEEFLQRIDGIRQDLAVVNSEVYQISGTGSVGESIGALSLAVSKLVDIVESFVLVKEDNNHA